MTVEETIARLFGLRDDEWRRHANPVSVYSRFTLLPLFVAAAWSREWIGVYFLVPLALTLLWTWLNPRLFPEPDSFDSWASRGVLGERIWANRADYEIPRSWALQTTALTALSAVGTVPFLVGLYRLDGWLTAVGLLVTFLAKLWFFDRMVWLYDDFGGAAASGVSTD